MTMAQKKPGFVSGRMHRKLNLVASFVALILAATPAAAQSTLNGDWAGLFHEDQPERGPGPELGDYLGLPINAAARQWADSWDASRLTLPEHQCRAHVSPYIYRGPIRVRITEERDPVTQEVFAMTHFLSTYAQVRTLWLDGRAHPHRCHRPCRRRRHRVHQPVGGAGGHPPVGADPPLGQRLDDDVEGGGAAGAQAGEVGRRRGLTTGREELLEDLLALGRSGRAGPRRPRGRRERSPRSSACRYLFAGLVVFGALVDRTRGRTSFANASMKPSWSGPTWWM